MKIIRLVSDEVTKSIFQKSTSAPIMIKPNSTIALKSLSFELKHDLGFVIDSDDYIMAISTDGTTFKTVLMPRGKYTRTTFLDYLAYKFNLYMNAFLPAQAGTEWAITTQNDKVNICVARSDSQTVTNFSLLNMTADENSYSKTNASNIFNSYAQCKSFICRGGTVNTITVGGNSQNKFIYGLCNQLFDTTQKTTLSMDDFICCVFSDGITGNYKVKYENGEVVESNIPINQNDVIKIAKYNLLTSDANNVRFFIGTTQIGNFLPSQNFVLSQLYTTFVLGECDELFNLNTPTQYTSPFCKVSADGSYSSIDSLPSIYANDNLQAAAIKTAIRFDTLAMQTFMGFTTNQISLNGVSSNYVANNIFGLPLTFQAGDDLVVELQNLNLDGYDFLENKKASIVSVIPIESLSKSVFGYSYIEPFPTFLSLNNDQMLNINSFYVTIKSGGQLLDVEDKIFIQLLVND